MKKIFFLLLLIIIIAHKTYAQAYQYSKKTNKEAFNFSSGASDSLYEHTPHNLYVNDTCINRYDNMHLPSEEYNRLCKTHMNTEWIPGGFPFSAGTTYPTLGDVSKWILSWSEALKGFSIP